MINIRSLSDAAESRAETGSMKTSPVSPYIENGGFEGPAEELATGYEGFARFMGKYPELAIFRRFGALNLQNIIYLQAEITELEKKWYEMALEDNRSPDWERQMFSRHWARLAENHKDREGGFDPSYEPTDSRYQLVIQLRTVLRDYNTALMQQAQILALQRPAENDLKFLRTWLISPNLGNNFLVGADSDTWLNDKRTPDLITLRPRSDNDKKFSKRATDFLIPLFHRYIGRRLLGGEEAQVEGLVDYSSSSLLLVMQVVTAILSSLLLMISVVVLYFVRDAGARLGIIGAFTVVYSLGLALFSGANRNEIFGATAACIAVQIVFVGTN